MASLDFLPAATYEAPSPVQAPRRRRSLNTIMEDDEESMRGGDDREDDRGRRGSPSPKAPSWSDWRSPLSDHFPTPRGNHFMIAPLMPASPSSPADSEYSQTSSGPWTRDSVGTQATDFDDLYDVSSDEEDSYKARQARSSIVRETSSRKSTASPRQRNSLPSLIIPQSNEQWKAMAAFKKLASPVPPTPPPKVPMSPAVFQYLAEQSALAVPSSSAPPSLDGSLTSEQMALMSAPPTPNTGNEESGDVDQWGGVQLQPAAMATLQAFALDDLYDIPEQVIELPIRSPTTEMQQSPPPINTSIHRNNSVVLSPEQQQSMNSLTAIEIPSPGGFFASLSNVSRHTWHIMPSSLNNEAPPSSATAEHFYKTPWMSEPIERIVEVTESMSDGCPTARPILLKTDSEETIKGLDSPIEEIIATEIISDYDVTYVRKLNEDSLEHFDRTQLWLTAQTSYLSALINPTEARDDEVAIQRRDSQIVRGGKATVDSDSETASKKKTVRFSEVPTSVLGVSIVVGRPLPQLTRLESAYFRSFRTIVALSRYRDTFVHRTPRFEALQIQRTNFPEAYRNQLLGKFQLSVVPMSAKKRMSSNVARGDETAPEDPAKLKADKEREAKEQMSAATWNVTAMKMLNGGRLIAAPVAKRLARLSRMGPSANGTPRDRARILDLGGQATCDWAWHCATEYPNTKVYTVTTKTSRQLSNSNIHGPANHRQVTVNKLTSLPFKDDQFDLISARNLAHILKACSENGEDEYDACLAECMRILKPGGYLEFNMLDSDIMNAGPLGQAKSVEFGFSLKTRGYDATPTKAWLGRLSRAGFVGVKRAWMVLPMGAPTPVARPVSRDSMGVERPLELEAMVTGSTAAAASITGLVGGWAWEKWMLKLQMEIGVAEENLLEGVGEIVEEGRQAGAGWRGLSGWARKPMRG
ncbi:hypothetical protein V499_03932 [Pseudogymnoascus sp. VKM F-103]|nr:hypothetical protein V499_03932 [Pseudogymnoascus sp. VKM F-103]